MGLRIVIAGRPITRAIQTTKRCAIIRERAVELLSRFSNWLDIRRVTTHAAIASMLIWLMFAFNLTRAGFLDRSGKLKGTDFLQFYAAGLFGRAHRIAEMYGVHQFAAATERAIGGIQGWHYLPVYPPQVGLMFWPFAFAPYLTAFAMWSVLNVLLYVGCLAAIAHLYPKITAHRPALILAAFAFPPFFNEIAHGQVSILVLACVVGSFYAFIRGEKFIAGIALGCTAFKPPIFVAFMVACIAVRGFRLVTGMTVAAAAQLAGVLVLAGLDSVRAYFRFAVKLPRVNDLVLAGKPYQMHSLRSFWMLLGTGRFDLELWLLSSLVVLVMLARYWRRESQSDLQFAALIVAATLIDPHVYIYDVVIIAPALIVALERARVLGATVAADAVRAAVYVLFGCLFLGPLSRITHLQLSVPVMAALLFAMTRATGAEGYRERWVETADARSESSGLTARPVFGTSEPAV
jgi:arabinofuranan 3-O-arabinosyltransferase